MYCGKRRELETQGATGDYYSIWLECETFGGEGLHPDTLETGIEVDAYDTWDEARDVIFDAFCGTAAFPDFLDANPDVAWVAAIIEKNEFVDGIDKGFETPAYPLMLDRTDGTPVFRAYDENGFAMDLDV